MAAYVDPRFRPTLWPGTAIPAPFLRRHIKDVRIEGDWILWTPVPFDERPLVQLPEDFYLRELMELSADGLDGVTEMFRTYGSLVGAGRNDLYVDSEDVYEEVQSVPEAGGEEQPHPFGVHRDLVRIYVQTAQEAITTWLACQEENGLEELVKAEVTEENLASIQAQNEGKEPPWPPSLEYLQALLIESRIVALKSVLNSALSPFSIGIGDLADRYPTAYSVAFLQLYNHLVEGALVRRCANETCRQNFVRQRGRAEYGQNRTSGVKYCSRECARAQAQRALRRRRKHTNPPT
ncbi:hypothetical protein ABZS71_28200 [Streptomyces sp. NPDC005393]|uniref:hypothetical protein n=1 Tax=Streptomyces sp. NPDC005393 TaxID=3157041 RepID=UPI0033B41556